jgi:hypothetical protein
MRHHRLIFVPVSFLLFRVRIHEEGEREDRRVQLRRCSPGAEHRERGHRRRGARLPGRRRLSVAVHKLREKHRRRSGQVHQGRGGVRRRRRGRVQAWHRLHRRAVIHAADDEGRGADTAAVRAGIPENLGREGRRVRRPRRSSRCEVAVARISYQMPQG